MSDHLQPTIPPKARAFLDKHVLGGAWANLSSFDPQAGSIQENEKRLTEFVGSLSDVGRDLDSNLDSMSRLNKDLSSNTKVPLASFWAERRKLRADAKKEETEVNNVSHQLAALNPVAKLSKFEAAINALKTASLRKEDSMRLGDLKAAIASAKGTALKKISDRVGEFAKQKADFESALESTLKSWVNGLNQEINGLAAEAKNARGALDAQRTYMDNLQTQVTTSNRNLTSPGTLDELLQEKKWLQGLASLNEQGFNKVSKKFDVIDQKAKDCQLLIDTAKIAGQDVSASTQALLAALKEVEENGTVISAKTVKDEFASRKAKFESALNALSKPAMKGFQQRDPQSRPDDAEKASNSQLEAAIKLFMAAKDKDEKNLGSPGQQFTRAAALPTYKVGEAFSGSDWAKRLTEPSGKKEDIEAAVSVATNHVATAFDNPKSDIAFDLILKSREDFENNLEATLGDDAKGTRTIARAMEAKVRELNPCKMSSDGSSVTIDGRTYKKGKQLGKGANGAAHRYEDEQSGQSVVVKSLLLANSPEMASFARENMVGELKAHRQAMGADGKGHQNMVRLIGAGFDGNGNLFSIQEDCQGGDVEHFAPGMQAAAEGGILSPQARNALVRAMFKEAAQGLQHVAASGMNHSDIKDANFFLGADGTVKIGDFGESGLVDDKGVGGNPGSPLFSPEMVSTGKRDVFMLGAMLDVLDGGVGVLGRDKYVGPETTYAGPATQTYGQQSRATGHQETALDRLRNAMLDPDPAKRPTIDAVMLASYLDGEEESQEKLVELKKALIDYSREIGDKAAGPLKEIARAKDKIKESQRQLNKIADDQEKQKKRDAHIKLLEQQLAVIRKQQELINAINKDSKSAQALKDASSKLRPARPRGV